MTALQQVAVLLRQAADIIEKQSAGERKQGLATLEEAAEYLGCSERSVRRHIPKRLTPYRKPGHRGVHVSWEQLYKLNNVL